ncbi:hypothetical protein P4503_31125, partial [Bacillus thuringiensis]|nr:hypothetical protein [Bacillus thuringiensis]
TAEEGIYNHQSEIYFVGKLFSNILGENLTDFKFKYIIDKMIQLDPQERYMSFHDISAEISQGVLAISFTEEEKSLYKDFAEILSKYIVSHSNKYEPVNDPNIIMTRLSTLIRNSSLENYIQHNSQLINCFIDNSYTFITATNIPISTIINFYKFLQKIDPYKQKIVLDNIDMRLSMITIEIEPDELPF